MRHFFIGQALVEGISPSKYFRIFMWLETGPLASSRSAQVWGIRTATILPS